MANSLGPLEELGRHVASVLDEAAPERARAIEEAKRTFLHDEARSARSPRFRARRVLALAAVLAVCAAISLVLSQRQRSLDFEVEGSPGATKTWLAASKSGALHLRFSDGTTVALEAGSRARVQDIDSVGASIGLESGRLRADVVHTAASVWKIIAGPFTVNVTGTVFDVSWDPSAQQLAVNVLRGSVLVADSSTGAAQPVRASETLRATSGDRHFELSSVTSAAAPAESGVAPPDDAPAESVSAVAPTPELSAAERHDLPSGAQPGPAKRGGSLEEWRVFAKRGALREAFQSAELAGFEQTCESASPSELLVLGDGARLSGNAERASFALLTLRKRYPGDSRRAAAAFSLGKVAFDQRGAYEQAAQWFSTALREQPGGPLAREASGRLIEALLRAHDVAGTQRAARDYLSKYPEGPHADLARSVLR